MKKFGTFILSNLDTLLAIAISMVAAIFGVFGGNVSFLISAIAGTLGLLAYGLIKDRIARENLLRQLQQLNNKTSVSDILKDRNAYVPLNETLDAAKHICLVGPSLINLFSHWKGYFYFTKLNEHGATIHAITLDPDCSAIESTAKCMNEPVDNLRLEIKNALLSVESMLRDEYGVKKGVIELRLMQSNPNYSMVLIDPDKPNGRMFVEFIGYHSRLHTRPHIELTRQRDKEWFDYFFSQYLALWDHSKVHLTSKREASKL